MCTVRECMPNLRACMFPLCYTCPCSVVACVDAHLSSINSIDCLSCNICDHEIRMFAIVEIYCQVTVIPLNQMSILDQGSQVGYLYRNEHSPVGKPSGSSSSDEYSTRDEILYKSLCRDDQCQRSSFRCCAFYVILGSNRQYGYIAHKLLCC